MLHLVHRLCACLFLQIFFYTRTIITFSLEHLFVFVVFALTQFCFLFLFLLENFLLVWLCFNTYTHTHSHPHSQTKRNFNMLFYFLSFVSYFVILFISLVFLLFLKQLLYLYIAIVLQLQHCCLFNLLTHTHTRLNVFYTRHLVVIVRRRRFFVFNGQLIYSTVTKHTRVLFDSFIR